MVMVPTRIEDRLTPTQLQTLGARIISRFYAACSGGTQYGCDWPTMWALFPRECRVYRRLRVAYQRQQT